MNEYALVGIGGPGAEYASMPSGVGVAYPPPGATSVTSSLDPYSQRYFIYRNGHKIAERSSAFGAAQAVADAVVNWPNPNAMTLMQIVTGFEAPPGT